MSMRPVLAFILTILLCAPVAQAADVPAANGDKRIPYKDTIEGDTGVSVLRVVLGFGLVLAVGVSVIFILRRYLPATYGVSGSQGARQIDLIEMRRLTPKLTLFLVKVGDERILFSHSGDRVTRMHSTRSASLDRNGAASTDA